MTTLTELFTGIANAIRSKTGKTDQIVAENFATEIAAISTGTDTSDANATAANIEAGKTAYVNGQKVTGNLQSANNITSFATPQEENGYILLGGSLGYKTIIKPSSNISFKSAYANFGDATAADVAAGKTFTGADGLKVEGTASSKINVIGEFEKDMKVGTAGGASLSTHFDFNKTGLFYIELSCRNPETFLRYEAYGRLNNCFAFFDFSGNQYNSDVRINNSSSSLYAVNYTKNEVMVHVKIIAYSCM